MRLCMMNAGRMDVGYLADGVCVRHIHEKEFVKRMKKN